MTCINGRPQVGDVMGLSGVAAGLGIVVRTGAIGGCCLILANCGQVGSRVDPKYGVSASPRVVQVGERAPKGGGYFRVGKSYTIAGQTYSPEENTQYSAEGIASWYGEDFHGRLTANGEIYDLASISAAHPTLPIPSYARVTNLSNKRSIIVRVNDRGPFHRGRVIDLSVRAAKLLGFYDEGTTRVRVDYVGLAALSGSDDAKLEATLRRGAPAPGPGHVRVASSRSTPSAAHRSLPATAPASPQLASNVASASFSSRFAPLQDVPQVAARAEPVSAFAPEVPVRSNGAVITGRGLY